MDSVSVEKILDLLQEWPLPLEVESSAQTIVPLLSKLVIVDDANLAQKAASILEKPITSITLIASLIFDQYIGADTPRRVKLLKLLAQAAGNEALPLLRQALEKHPEDLSEIVGAVGSMGAAPTIERVNFLWNLAQARKQQLVNTNLLSGDSVIQDILRQLENIEQNAALPPEVRDVAGARADEIDAWLKPRNDAPSKIDFPTRS
jgi:hypothetical protein